MRGVRLDQRIRRTLGVELEAGLGLTFDSVPSAPFPAHLQQPTGENSTSDLSPRQGRASATLWLGSRLAVTLRACDRVEIAGTEYELLAFPREVTEGRATVGHRVSVLPVGELYPRTAAVHALGSDEPAGEIACALFSLISRNAPRGDYKDAFAEAPPAALELLTSDDNVELRFEGGETWKVSDASLSPEVPFVAMRVTRV